MLTAKETHLILSPVAGSQELLMKDSAVALWAAMHSVLPFLVSYSLKCFMFSESPEFIILGGF